MYPNPGSLSDRGSPRPPRVAPCWGLDAARHCWHHVLMGIELHSIDFVPEHERHGRVQDQGPFWFLSNFHFFAIAIGFVGPSLGLSLGATILAASLGIVVGTA